MIFENTPIENKIKKIETREMTSSEIQKYFNLGRIKEIEERKVASPSNLDRLSKNLETYGAIAPISLLRDDTSETKMYFILDGHLRLNACYAFIIPKSLDINFQVDIYSSSLNPAQLYTFFNTVYAPFNTLFFEFAQREKLKIAGATLPTETISLEKLNHDEIEKVRDLIELQCPTCNVAFDAFEPPEPTEPTEPTERKIYTPKAPRGIPAFL